MNNSLKRKSKKKLLTYNCLFDFDYKLRLGVSMSELIRQLDYRITPPTLKRLLYQFGAHRDLLSTVHKSNKQTTRKLAIYDSFFPGWFGEEITVQQCPNGTYYVGLFPYGKWVTTE